MRVKPYSTLRIAYTDSLTLEPDTEAAPDRAALLQGDGVALEYRVEGGSLKLPKICAPNTVRINWYEGETLLFTTFLVVVTRHYFDIAQLRAMDDMDDFSDKTEEEFWAARQSATEIFEKNARRSFVQQMGTTETFEGGFVWLDHNDVHDILTPGWVLVSDCQAKGPEGRATIRYRYGFQEVPERVSEAVLALAAYYLRPSATPDRATGESTDAGFIRYTLAGKDGATGLPEVDAAIEQFGRSGVMLL